MAKPLDKNRPTNRKQKKFIKKVAETLDVPRSAAMAGYEPGYGSFLMKQPRIMSELQVALEKAGLDDDVIANKLKEGLEAYYVKKDDGTEYPDFHAREKYIVDLIKVKGGFAPEKHEIKQEKLTLIVTPEVIKGLKDAKAVTEAELEVLDAEVIEEERNGDTS